MNGVGVVARLAWKRLVRGRAFWISVVLFAIPILVAVVAMLRVHDPGQRWSLVAELTFRSLVLLAPVIHLSGSLGEEIDGQTYSYFWSRPIAREVVLAGKFLAMAPILALLAPLALTLAYLLVGGELAWLLRAAPAAALGAICACSFAVGLGALVPRHPLVAALGWSFLAEQVLPVVPAVQNLSAVHHVEVIAALPDPLNDTSGTALGSTIALVVLSTAWLAIAVWRVRRLEPGSVSP